MRKTYLLMSCALAACSSRERADVGMSSAVVESLAVVESGGVRTYRTYSPGGALELEDDLPDDARLTVLGFDRSLRALEMIDAAGRLRLAQPSTPAERSAPFPEPIEGWVGPVLGPYQPLELAGWSEGFGDRVELSGCAKPERESSPIGHPGFTPVFLTSSREDVWVLFPRVVHDDNQRGRAYRCRPGMICAQQRAVYPDHVVRPVGAVDVDGTPWWHDGERGWKQGLDGASTSSITLPLGVAPVGVVMHADAVFVLDDQDRLHRFARTGSTGWGTPRDLAGSLPPRTCRAADSMSKLWVDASGTGGALLTRACRWVDVTSSTATPTMVDAGATGLAYGRDGPIEALLVESGARPPLLFRRYPGATWAEVDIGATPGGAVFGEHGAEAGTVAVVGGDILTVRSHPDTGTEEILSAHGWAAHPHLAPLACAPDPHSIPALAPGGWGALGIRRKGDPTLQWLAVRAE